jgi:hypothetical protein
MTVATWVGRLFSKGDVPSLKTLKQTGKTVVDSVPIKPAEDWDVVFNPGKPPRPFVDEFVPTGSPQKSSLQGKVALPDIPHEQLKFPPHYFNEEHRPVATWDEPPLPGHP